VWADTSQVYYKKSTDGGSSWATKRLTWSSGNSSNPAITVDSSNKIHVIYHDDTFGNSEIYFKNSTDGGSSWITKRLTWNSGDSFPHSISTDSSNYIHVVSYDDTSGSYEVYYMRSIDGGISWTNERLTWNPGSSTNPVVALDSSDNIHVIWEDSAPVFTDLYYRKGIQTTIAELLSQVQESEILATASDLQNFGTRELGYQGNVDAATYIHDRFAAIPGLSVTYHDVDMLNVIASLPGTDENSDKVYIVGAHYDSISSMPGVAPGATDNACGVAIVLELARIMSKYSFKNDLKFAAWNGEEVGLIGSRSYVLDAVQNQENIQLYINYDSTAYDPDGGLVLDIIFNELSSGIAQRMEQINSSYGLGFTIVNNVHSCISDHRAFWDSGFCSVTTHTEGHGPAHTPDDTVDKISTLFAKKNGQLGMAVLAELAVLEDKISPTGKSDINR
jgi:hypothetical protein